LLTHFSSATNRIIGANDTASVQINIGHLDANGVYTGTYTPISFSGYVRSKAESDHAMNRLAAEHQLIKDINSFPKEHKFRKEQ
jgi:hypothetical protein